MIVGHDVEDLSLEVWERGSRRFVAPLQYVEAMLGGRHSGEPPLDVGCVDLVGISEVVGVDPLVHPVERGEVMLLVHPGPLR